MAAEPCRGTLFCAYSLLLFRQGKLTTHREEANSKNPNLQDLLSAEVHGLCPKLLDLLKHIGSPAAGKRESSHCKGLRTLTEFPMSASGSSQQSLAWFLGI